MLALVFALALGTPAHAAETPEPFPLQNTSAAFLGAEMATSLFLGFMGPDLILEPTPVDMDCADAWCEPPGIDRFFNRAIALDNPRTAGHVSHVFTIGLTPAFVIGGSIVGAARAGQGWWAVQDSVIIIDSFLLTTGANSIAKNLGRRQRPAHYYNREGRTEAAGHDGEEFLSFYSGDTTWAWTLAASGTTLAYLRGYEHARWVAVGSSVLAFTGSFLRMSADMHWFTDVVVGTTIGTAIGAGLPLLLHRRKKDKPPAVSVRVDAGVERAGLRLSGRW